MAHIKVTFKKCIQDSQEYGSSNEHMISRICFDMEVDGVSKGEFHADLKQVVGSEYESGEIEVGRPINYTGIFNQYRFASAAQNYFRQLVGTHGNAIRIEGGAKSIRMRNITHKMIAVEEFETE